MMSKRRFGLLPLGAIVLWTASLALFAADEAKDVRQRVHPRAWVEACPEKYRAPGALTVERALALAVKMFEEVGVQHLCICEVRWVESPVSGYLVDALGDLEMKVSHGSLGEEGHYSLFRLGISDRPQGDGSCFPNGAGGEFVFVAKGTGPDGQPKWYPPSVLTDVAAMRLKGDPQAETDLKFPLVYFVKYFLDQERFASLPERYVPCEPSGQ
jgi:hypothetical protein